MLSVRVGGLEFDIWDSKQSEGLDTWVWKRRKFSQFTCAEREEQRAEGRALGGQQLKRWANEWELAKETPERQGLHIYM